MYITGSEIKFIMAFSKNYKSYSTVYRLSYSITINIDSCIIIL